MPKKKPSLTFYKTYDKITKDWVVHSTFFAYLQKNIRPLSSTYTAHHDLVKIFIKFINTSLIENDSLANESIKEYNSTYKHIYTSCYKSFFNTPIPHNPKEIERALFNNEKNCFKLFDEKYLKNIAIQDHPNSEFILDEFRFIRDFAKFIYANRKKEPIDFFKRFLFIYPFEKTAISLKYNSDWRKHHEKFFNTILLDKDSSPKELQIARLWYKKQLEQIDFRHLNEKEKETFVTEAFIAFGNISSEKSGQIEGFVHALKAIFYLGRYYNIHLLPLKYIEWKKGDNSKEQRRLANIIHETYRHLRKKPLLFDKTKISKTKANKIAVDPGRNKRRIDVERMLTQEPYGPKVSEHDNLPTMYQNLMNNISLSQMTKNFDHNNPGQNILDTLTDAANSSGIAEVLQKNVSAEEKKKILEHAEKIVMSNHFTPTLSVFPQLTYSSINKAGFGLITHYACSNNRPPVKAEKIGLPFFKILFNTP